MNVEMTIWGLSGAVVTALILETLKMLIVDREGNSRITGRVAIAVSLVVGQILSVAVYLAEQFPAAATIVNVIGSGLLAALAASGVYSVGKHIRNRK